MTPYDEYLTLWNELDALCQAGDGETPEADALRDRMDHPWRAMTDEEQERFQGERAER